MEQISFSDAEYSAKKKITRREKLLLEMEQIVPWAILLREIEPLYPVAGRGRRPYPCASMLRIHLMQHWFALSDPGMEDALYEIESMRHFAGIKLNAVPDETTILNFRRFIEDNDLSIDILDKINQHLARKGLLLKTGTVVEHPFHTLKCVFSYTKARFKGLAKNTSQVVLLFALVNLHRVRKKLMALKERHEWGKFKAEVRLKTA